MYVPRRKYEQALIEDLSGTQHIVIHGESGSGKSWLFKKVLTEIDADWINVNLASADRVGSIVRAISDAISEPGVPIKTGFVERKSAGAGIPLIKAEVAHEANYELQQADEFRSLLRLLRKRAGGKVAVVVLDNLEAIFDNKERMRELGNLIILCDDSAFAEFEVHFVIVGVPSDLREYYTKVQHFLTVATRLVEIPEVKSFTKEETAALVNRGFVDQLGFSISKDGLSKLCAHVHYVTLGNPLRIHEYCLIVARLMVENNGKLVPEFQLRIADSKWLSRSLHAMYGQVESLMNSRATRVGRRNQCLYALGILDKATFEPREIEAIVRREFPKTTKGKKNLNVTSMLTEIEASGQSIRQTHKGNRFVLRDPKFRMCLRAMLVKDQSEHVAKRDLDDVDPR